MSLFVDLQAVAVSTTDGTLSAIRDLNSLKFEYQTLNGTDGYLLVPDVPH